MLEETRHTVVFQIGIPIFVVAVSPSRRLRDDVRTTKIDISILMDAKDGDKFKLDEHRYQIVNGNIVCLTKDKGL